MYSHKKSSFFKITNKHIALFLLIFLLKNSPTLHAQHVYKVDLPEIKNIVQDSLHRIWVLSENNALFRLEGSTKIALPNPKRIIGLRQLDETIIAYSNTQVFTINYLNDEWLEEKVFNTQQTDDLQFNSTHQYLRRQGQKFYINEEICFDGEDQFEDFSAYQIGAHNAQWFIWNKDHIMSLCENIQNSYVADSILCLLPSRNQKEPEFILKEKGWIILEKENINIVKNIQDTLTNACACGGKVWLSSKKQTQVYSLRNRKLIESKPITDKTYYCINNTQIASQSNGFLSIDPKGTVENIYIDFIKTNGVKLDRLRNYQANGAKQNFVVQLSSNLPPISGKEYYYQLNGKEDKWTSFDIREALLIEVEKGDKFVLNVRSDNNGEIKTTPKICQFNHQEEKEISGWKFVAIGLFILSLISLAANWKNRTERKKIERLKEQLQLQSEVSNMSNKVRQLQMNPHFLFNALNSIGGLIALNKNKEARKYLNELSQLMRSMLTQDPESNLQLKDEILLLEKYLSLEQLCSNQGFEYSINISEESLGNLTIPGMLVQPFVENAIKHGIRWKKEKGQIIITFYKQKNRIKCIVDDNGVGRAYAETKKVPGHNSVALNLIHERLSTHFKFMSKDELIKIIDKEESGVAKGTQVEIIIPILAS